MAKLISQNKINQTTAFYLPRRGRCLWRRWMTNRNRNHNHVTTYNCRRGAAETVYSKHHERRGSISCCLWWARLTTASVPESQWLFLLFAASRFSSKSGEAVSVFSFHAPIVGKRHLVVLIINRSSVRALGYVMFVVWTAFFSVPVILMQSTLSLSVCVWTKYPFLCLCMAITFYGCVQVQRPKFSKVTIKCKQENQTRFNHDIVVLFVFI